MKEQLNIDKGIFFIKSNDFEKAGEASSEVRSILIKNNISHEIVKRASIATFEAEVNVIVHTIGGILEYEVHNNILLQLLKF